MEYAKCLVELDEVLYNLSNEDLKKIPEDIRDSIKEQKDKTYTWKYDKSKTLNEQKIDRKTIAMLSYLNMEYLLNEEQKELMKKFHKSNEEKLEKIKQNKYKSEDIFKNSYEVKERENVALIEVKKEKNFIQKLIAKLKLLFKR